MGHTSKGCIGCRRRAPASRWGCSHGTPSLPHNQTSSATCAAVVRLPPYPSPFRWREVIPGSEAWAKRPIREEPSRSSSEGRRLAVTVRAVGSVVCERSMHYWRSRRRSGGVASSEVPVPVRWLGCRGECRRGTGRSARGSDHVPATDTYSMITCVKLRTWSGCLAPWQGTWHKDRK